MTESEMLQIAITEGIIDMDVIHRQIEDMTNKKFLEMHTNAVWQGEDGFWRTKLPKDENGNRKLLKKKHRKDLDLAIINYYKEHQEDKTLGCIFEEWLNRKVELKEICKGTADRYSNDFKRYFGGSYLESTPVGIITEEDLEDFIRETIAEKNLTAKAYGNMRTLIVGTFKYAKRQGLTGLSISQFFGDIELSRRIFRREKKNFEEQVFTEEETKKLINWLENNPSVENYGLILAFYAGIRTAELAALRFEDIKGNKLHVQRQEIKYKDIKGSNVHLIVEYTKTDAGDRVIFLPQKAIEVIDKIKELNPCGEFIMEKAGRRFYTNIFNHRLYKACEAVGIPKRSMHKIRKTYGTALIDSGVDEGFIKAQMGHSDIETTKKYYYFSNRNDTKRTEQIEKAFACF